MMNVLHSASYFVKDSCVCWHEAVDKNDKDYLSKHVCPGLDRSFWDNWTEEEIEYYSNAERFPILKSKDDNGKEYIPLWDKRNAIWSVDYSWLLPKYLAAM